MKNKIYFKVSLLLFIILLPSLVHGMVINEIMYDVLGTDSGREWIEVYNDSSESVDFSKWKILENSVNHSVKLITGSEIIPAGGFAIIADNDVNFVIDNPNYKGTLFDSVFSLTNTGETLALVDSTGKNIHEISFSDTLGAKGDGNSLQLNDSLLISAPSTPGSKNETQTSIPESTVSTTTVSTTTSAHSSPKLIIKPKEQADFELSVGRDRVSSIKTPVYFEAYTSDDLSLRNTRYLWNFGDGNQEKGRKVEHFYKHPGLYNVVLNASFNNHFAVARSVIKVFKPELDVKINEEGLVFSNLGSTELNIGGWKLKNEEHSIKFIFPKDTIISPKTEIVFDRELFITKDIVISTSTLVMDLFFPNGDKVLKKSDIII